MRTYAVRLRLQTVSLFPMPMSGIVGQKKRFHMGPMILVSYFGLSVAGPYPFNGPWVPHFLSNLTQPIYSYSDQSFPVLALFTKIVEVFVLWVFY